MHMSLSLRSSNHCRSRHQNVPRHHRHIHRHATPPPRYNSQPSTIERSKYTLRTHMLRLVTPDVFRLILAADSSDCVGVNAT
ncbi:hypothetical protein P692DRAFT_20545978 [Suillus brevipes Sb2]|nr:hypothetical protein P692DRAFT_20545978 [Suillus brevipes Sb2]